VITHDDGNETIFNLVNNISQNLKADNPDYYLNEQALEKLDRFEYRIQQLISRNGSSQRFLEMATTRFEDFSLFLTDYLSKEQDADMMEVYTSLANQQSILQAALKTGSSVMMTSLVDFVLFTPQEARITDSVNTVITFLIGFVI